MWCYHEKTGVFQLNKQPQTWNKQTISVIQLTNCKVQMKMRVHRPLQQPIVSAGKSRLFAGKDGPGNGSAELSACRPHSDSHSPPVAPLRRFSARSKRTAGSVCVCVCVPLLLPHLRWLTGWLRTGVLKEEEERGGSQTLGLGCAFRKLDGEWESVRLLFQSIYCHGHRILH